MAPAFDMFHSRGRNVPRLMVIAGILALPLAGTMVGVAEAQTSTTPGAVALSSTFESISVRATFSGDSNGNNSATIRFRQAGVSAWTAAYTPMIDHRASLGGATNPYVNEARGSIVGLAASTSYEVQVTWSDPDGVGTQPSISPVSTLSYTPPTGGSTINVTPVTLASALTTVSPGQTIHLNPGVYAPFVISRSGNAGSWITVEGDASGGSIVLGAGAAQNLAVNGNFLVIQHLTLAASDSSGIVVGNGARHHIFIQDNTLQNISALCGNDSPPGPGSHYGDTGILISDNSNNIFVLRNSIASAALNSPACTFDVRWNSPGAGIGWSTVNTLVIRDNVVTGGFRDAISMDDDLTTENVDIAGNTVNGYKDDGVESKGGNVNVRLWNNRILGDQADTCIAGNTNITTDTYGPLYIFRNTCVVTIVNVQSGAVFKLGGGTPMYLFHNSVDAFLASSAWDGYSIGANVTAFNNILKTGGSGIDYGSGIFDYNIYFIASSLSYLWNGGSTYDTIAQFRSATGQEVHGKVQDPKFLDAQLHVDSSSPASNAGVVIANFNDASSAWPFRGTAPEIGAFEVAGGGANPSAPQGLRIVP